MTNPQKRISVALLIGALLIAGALFVRTNTKQTSSNKETVTITTSVLQRKPIKTVDGNNDGVPDWQEALLTTTPLELPSEENTLYQEPDTLTEQFALDFFKDMVRSKNYGAFGASTEELVSKTSTELAQQVQDTLITNDDILISKDNSTQALNDYGESIARIAYANANDNTENEITIFEDALRQQDAESLAKLDPIITYYGTLLQETKKISVPSLSAQDHINLLNSYQALQNDITAMRSAFDDPMRALLRIKRYQDDVLGMEQAIIAVYTALLDRGASWDNNSIVFSLIAIDDEN